ncbi:ubiquitin-like protein SMT3 [Melanaphis sacchari]|uniref:ubiquitin-like protein SMT3 n=1 Tax=Melanaphis sacchari TaxID=742174 RepID=UPI000DC12F71|nr:ubiquitin-like protein SMT3 [Melanaphis sacchari]
MDGTFNDSENSIIIQVRSMWDGNIDIFKLSKKHPLRKTMESYSERIGVDFPFLRFFFKGRPIAAENTPEYLNIEHSDIINCYQFRY